MRKRISVFLLVLALLIPAGSALAQDYSFQMPQEVVNVFWNEDGTASIDYVMTFDNDASGHAIEYVDLGLPNNNYDENSITADVDGVPVTDISSSGYQGTGSGVAIGLGSQSIKPGQTGTVHAFVGRVEGVLFADTSGDNFASAVFSPNYFGSSYAHGSTDLTVIFHLPPGVKPEEPRWHAAPSGFPAEPAASLDENGRVMYTWNNPSANPYSIYEFGASFPQSYVPAGAIVKEQPTSSSSSGSGGIDLSCLFPVGCFGFFGLFMIWGIVNERNRKMKYLPPKISIEGHGIKRGLTAVEAGVLMEQPMDKILTMILFATVKKNVATVTNRDPLTVQVNEPLPEDLREYEKEFLQAWQKDTKLDRNKGLQDTMVNLIKSVSAKIKGFSLKETNDYYRSIMEKAWQQVEAANTPEVKSEKFNEVMEWTMLDKDYGDRTRDVFRTGPVYVPVWWGRYDPGFGHTTTGGAGIPRTTTSAPSSRPSGSGSPLPVLPGADFAQSIVGGVQNFSQKTVGNISDFTSKVTNITNPVPKSTSRGGSSGGGHSCACACACAGCACACAGGGR